MHYCRLSNCFKAAITEGENWPDEEEATKEDVTATLRSLRERNRQWGAIKEPDIRRLSSRKPDLIYRRPWRSGLRRNTVPVSFSTRFRRRTRCNELGIRWAHCWHPQILNHIIPAIPLLERPAYTHAHHCNVRPTPALVCA
jgi:hypothetical protein